LLNHATNHTQQRYVQANQEHYELKKTLSLLLLYILIGISNLSFVNIYLSTSILPGGDIGMLPILIMILCLITTGISLAIVIIFHFLKKPLNYLKAILVYHLIYFGITGYETFGSVLQDWKDPHVQLNLWMLLISIIILIFSILISIYMDKSNKRTLKIK
jgi:hypothetical protein